MTFFWHDILGTAGVGLILIAYILLQVERIRSEQLAYSVMNALGAAMIMTAYQVTLSRTDHADTALRAALLTALAILSVALVLAVRDMRLDAGRELG